MATMRLRARRSGLVALVAGVVGACLMPTQALALPADAPPIGMICDNGTAAGGTRTFNLVAETGYMTTPEGNSVFMWSYGNGDAAAPETGAFQTPGPVLCANSGETVVVHLTNTLPEPSSITFSGQTDVTAAGGAAGLLTTEAPAAGGTVTYTFSANAPGTYLYQSGSDVTKQIQMGLYGALVVRPAGHADWLYADAATRFDPTREYLILLSDIDPDLHHAVETNSTYDVTSLNSKYFTVNGRSFPDTIQKNGVAWLPTQPYGALVRVEPYDAALNPFPAGIRILNAGLLNHPYHPHGNHMTQVAQDGRELATPTGASAATERFDETIASGQSQDYLLTWKDQDNWSPSGNQLPVAQPSYKTLFFKDGNTWYSGNPYLGYKGTLPTGTASQNVCGEWYFPWHSHALNEFVNFDVNFGGMATLLRVDPPGGCFAFPGSAGLVGGTLKSGAVSALATADTTYYQVNPKTVGTTQSMSSTVGTMHVGSAAGFPTSGNYYVRVGSEVLQVTGGQGTTTWTVTRHTLGTTATTHASGSTVTALATDWYGGFGKVPAGSQNLTVTYQGKNCATTTATTCTALTTNRPQQTVKVCDWTVNGAAGCSSATSNGWVTLPAPQSVAVGSTDVTNTWTLPGSADHYIGTGAQAGQVRVLVHTQRWTASNPTPFSTWGNLLKISYDAP